MQTNTHPWNITPEALQSNAASLPDIERSELIWAYNYCASKALTFQSFGAASGISGDTLRKIASGSYVDPRNGGRKLPMPSGMIDAIRNFREDSIASQPTSVRFTSTDLARRIWDNCKLAREAKRPSMMRGASQIGKTAALRKCRDANPESTWLITVTSGMAAKGLAVAICEELGISSNGSLSTLTARIGKHIHDDSLFLIDDFHVLTLASTPRTFLACMEFLRAVSDFGCSGMLLCTTDIDYENINKTYKSSLHQLIRRTPHIPHLGSQPAQRDVKTILEAHGLKWPLKSLVVNGVKPWQIISNLALESGLTVITERLRYALLIAARASVPVTWEHFVKADSAICDNNKEPVNDWI